MMTVPAPISRARLAATVRAEFLKIWASKIPLVILVALPLGTYLFVLELYEIEGIGDRLHGNALDALPILFFATWKTSMFQMAMLAFAAFWATVVRQYGMIRVACSQPISRLEYVLGKWTAIMAHVAIITVMLIASELAWTGIYSGVRGIRAGDIAAVASFAGEVTVFTVAVTSIGMAAASCRRTVGSGIVAAIMSFVLLALMTMVSFRVIAPDWVLMRYFAFALGELKNPFPMSTDSPFIRVHSVAEFYRVALVTPLLFILPALVYFRRRDIVE
jgi:ABC-type transport system involved in multi-copper enzyme maturation permease subunit